MKTVATYCDSGVLTVVQHAQFPDQLVLRVDFSEPSILAVGVHKSLESFRISLINAYFVRAIECERYIAADAAGQHLTRVPHWPPGCCEGYLIAKRDARPRNFLAGHRASQKKGKAAAAERRSIRQNFNWLDLAQHPCIKDCWQDCRNLEVSLEQDGDRHWLQLNVMQPRVPQNDDQQGQELGGVNGAVLPLCGSSAQFEEAMRPVVDFAFDAAKKNYPLLVDSSSGFRRATWQVNVVGGCSVSVARQLNWSWVTVLILALNLLYNCFVSAFHRPAEGHYPHVDQYAHYAVSKDGVVLGPAKLDKTLKNVRSNADKRQVDVAALRKWDREMEKYAVPLSEEERGLEWVGFGRFLVKLADAFLKTEKGQFFYPAEALRKSVLELASIAYVYESVKQQVAEADAAYWAAIMDERNAGRLRFRPYHELEAQGAMLRLSTPPAVKWFFNMFRAPLQLPLLRPTGKKREKRPGLVIDLDTAASGAVTVVLWPRGPGQSEGGCVANIQFMTTAASPLQSRPLSDMVAEADHLLPPASPFHLTVVEKVDGVKQLVKASSPSGTAVVLSVGSFVCPPLVFRSLMRVRASESTRAELDQSSVARQPGFPQNWLLVDGGIAILAGGAEVKVEADHVTANGFAEPLFEKRKESVTASLVKIDTLQAKEQVTKKLFSSGEQPKDLLAQAMDEYNAMVGAYAAGRLHLIQEDTAGASDLVERQPLEVRERRAHEVVAAAAESKEKRPKTSDVQELLANQRLEGQVRSHQRQVEVLKAARLEAVRRKEEQEAKAQQFSAVYSDNKEDEEEDEAAATYADANAAMAAELGRGEEDEEEDESKLGGLLDEVQELGEELEEKKAIIDKYQSLEQRQIDAIRCKLFKMFWFNWRMAMVPQDKLSLLGTTMDGEEEDGMIPMDMAEDEEDLCQRKKVYQNWKRIGVDPAVLASMGEEEQKEVELKLVRAAMDALAKRVDVWRQERLKLERKTVRGVKTTKKQVAAKWGRNYDMVVFGSPDVLGWVKGGKFSKKVAKILGQKLKTRRLARKSARLVLRMHLRSFFTVLLQFLAVSYGAIIIGPHEGFTTNSCLFCGRFKKGSFNGRYRRCPFDDCAGHNILLHREFASGLNQPVAARLQVDFIRGQE